MKSLRFPDTNPAIWVSFCLVIFFCLNAFAVKVSRALSLLYSRSLLFIASYLTPSLFTSQIYGEAEFYFASGKVILIIGFIVFTFVAMLGGNPHHDRIGFRYWKDPGPMNE